MFNEQLNTIKEITSLSKIFDLNIDLNICGVGPEGLRIPLQDHKDKMTKVGRYAMKKEF